MSECMTQEDAMNMSAEQAIQILKPMQMMMRDQHGCPISDAYFALGKALEALGKEPKWTPVKFRPMDEEEKQSIKPYLEEHYGYTLDECDCILFDCPMPDDGQEVWVCSKCGNVWQDTCVIDEGIGLEENGDWLDIVAWMPFERPKPYKGEEDA